MKRLGQLSLRQLRAQAAAVRHRSISAAAEELLLSPLAIYSQLNQLEETFGCALLRRSGVEALDATTEGAALIAAYCEARSAVERAVQKVDALTRGGVKVGDHGCGVHGQVFRPHDGGTSAPRVAGFRGFAAGGQPRANH